MVMVSVECPTAQAMLSLSRSLLDYPIQAYLCSWTAFDSLVRLIARQSGVKPQFNLRKNGTLKMQDVGGLRMPNVKPPRSKEIYSSILEKLDVRVKHALIVHKSVEVCAYRTPTFNNRVVKSDRRGQQLNGILDISRTLDPRYPIWCPITLAWYRTYLSDDGDDEMRDNLVRQIITILETLRENILYDDGRNSQECGPNLVVCAQPLLNLLINGLILDA
jgi:hypothetical protein